MFVYIDTLKLFKTWDIENERLHPRINVLLEHPENYSKQFGNMYRK